MVSCGWLSGTCRTGQEQKPTQCHFPSVWHMPSHSVLDAALRSRKTKKFYGGQRKPGREDWGTHLHSLTHPSSCCIQTPCEDWGGATMAATPAACKPHWIQTTVLDNKSPRGEEQWSLYLFFILILLMKYRQNEGLQMLSSLFSCAKIKVFLFSTRVYCYQLDWAWKLRKGPY